MTNVRPRWNKVECATSETGYFLVTTTRLDYGEFKPWRLYIRTCNDSRDGVAPFISQLTHMLKDVTCGRES